jgi:hypothetical protein
MSGGYSQYNFVKMSRMIMACSNCEVLCMAHPNCISKIVYSSYLNNYQPYYDLEINNTYKTMLCGIEIKPCKLMRYNQLFLFPYEFKDGFPIVCGKSGIMEFY